MTRSTFLHSLMLAPIALAAKAIPTTEPKNVRPGVRKLWDVPPDAGEVAGIISYQNRVFIACKNGVYFTDEFPREEKA